jgi:Na+/H+ antiporter NhaD/arsenite permease-like protein
VFRLSAILFFTSLAIPLPALAATAVPPDLTGHWVGYLCAAIFLVAYLLVMVEEFIHLRKSKPIILAAGLIWALIAWVSYGYGVSQFAEQALRENLLEYMELMLFLLVAMTYINAMEERLVFLALRTWILRRGYSYRQLFWIIGLLAFGLSPLIDNLIIALLMCALVMAVGGHNNRFVALSCTAVVVAVNAGGTLSPFGDITTLMIWRRELVTEQGVITILSFSQLLIPALISFLVPAAAMHFTLPATTPEVTVEPTYTKRGAKRIIGLFLLTILTAITFNYLLHLPPAVGMLTGLSYLQFFGYYLKKTYHRDHRRIPNDSEAGRKIGDPVPFDVFNKVARAEWDTLLFFYGVVICIGGMGYLGYLGLGSDLLYHRMDTIQANIIVGLLSALVDNIAIIFSVLAMEPGMTMGQWLLMTLATAIGGSLLSIGSAAGVALMGQAHGQYTFFSHLKWSWAIALGYGAGILTHLWLNAGLF